MSSLLLGVRDASLDLETDDAASIRATQAESLDQLSDYILPRLVQLDAPLLAIVGGSTGAGKSTLVNSLVGEQVTESGVLRPTTRSPVLVHHPDDAEWFQPDRILPDLARTMTSGNNSYGLRLASTTKVPKGLAILDAPDVDSIDQGNRELAAQLLAAADLWLFVTSAARYADQVPWDYLRQAAERSTSVAVVLDRTSDDAVSEVRGHLARMMTSRGLSDSPLFTVPESGLDADGLLPPEAVAPMVEATLTEPGCQAYAFSPDLDDDDLIHLWELWDDEASLAGHFASPHMAVWQERYAGLPLASRNVNKYTVTDIIPLP
jgi:quinol monooxygenase YgiN